jgi:hypothetical protein
MMTLGQRLFAVSPVGLPIPRLLVVIVVVVVVVRTMYDVYVIYACAHFYLVFKFYISKAEYYSIT